ncbi:MAG: ATP-binding protein [Clostridia bacterium]|nr:ATP-binding protein [Clostridia bacterium]
MENKVNTHMFVMGVFSIIITIIFSVMAFYTAFENQVTFDLSERTDEIATTYEYLHNKDELQKFSNDKLRITLIQSDGTVLFESSSNDTDKMENHLERPEVQEALKNGKGTSNRYSETMNTDVFYCAKKLADGNIIRLSQTTNIMYSFFSNVIPYLVLLMIIMLAVSIFLSVILTKKLVKPINRIASELENIDEDTENDEKIYDELLPFISEIRHRKEEIRERLKLERQEKNKLSAVLTNMSDGMILVDQNKNIMLSSHKAEQILGFDDDYTGKNIIYASRRKELTDSINEAINGKANSSEMKINDKIYQIRSNPIIISGVQSATMCLMIDVTEKYRMEQIKQEFTANVSHELKTPLTSISGYAEMIESGIAQNDDVKNFAGKIRLESERMITLVKDIIRLSELDESDVRAEFEEISLLGTAQEAVKPLYDSAEKKNISLTVSGTDSRITANRYMINELIYNLCDNSIRYNKPNGKVSVKISDKTVTVSDTGIGIPEECQKRIFERFYRVDKSRSKQTGGTGLGLAIVKHIAIQHNAEIKVESELDKGTSISVIFK